MFKKRKGGAGGEWYFCCEKVRLKEIINWVKKKIRFWLCYVTLSTYSLCSSFGSAVLGTSEVPMSLRGEASPVFSVM